MVDKPVTLIIKGPMPLYEYQCQGCGKHLEIMQKMSEPPKKKCPECGGKLEKLISASGFQLKGSGWYKTDYASKPASSGEAKAESKSESKTEAKSETKTEGKKADK